MAIQNLVYVCRHVPQITTKSSDTPRIHCAKHMQQFVNMSIQLHAGLQCDPVQIAEVVQYEYAVLSFRGYWGYAYPLNILQTS